MSAAVAPRKRKTYTLKEASEVTGLSRETLYGFAAEGSLQLIKIGVLTLVDGSSLRLLTGAEDLE